MEKIMPKLNDGVMVDLPAHSNKGVSHFDDISDEQSIADVINEVAEQEGITYDQALQMFRKGLKMMHGHGANISPKNKAKAKAKRKASKQARKKNRK